MISYTRGNLLEAQVEALVNTVNTVGIMGKGIALMFKEAFPDNYRLYSAACKREKVQVGEMFITDLDGLIGPKWIVNFPTKKHWKNKTDLKWIIDGLADMRRFLQEHNVRSIAIPPLGCGNGGLKWSQVKPKIEKALGNLPDVNIIVYEPTSKYQNVSKHNGVEKLTPARALITEMIRQYSILGIDCSLLEIQKLAWFLERSIESESLENPLDLQFAANMYGPYAKRLVHLLDSLDGSYLHCRKRLADAGPADTIRFDDSKKEYLQQYLDGQECAPYCKALQNACEMIDGFQSPLGLELLATVDWLIKENEYPATIDGIRQGLQHWPESKSAAERKQRILDDRLIDLALKRLLPLSS